MKEQGYRYILFAYEDGIIGRVKFDGIRTLVQLHGLFFRGFAGIWLDSGTHIRNRSGNCLEVDREWERDGK